MRRLRRLVASLQMLMLAVMGARPRSSWRSWQRSRSASNQFSSHKRTPDNALALTVLLTICLTTLVLATLRPCCFLGASPLYRKFFAASSDNAHGLTLA